MKNFIKNNITVVVTVLAIFAGGSALAVYSDLTPITEGGQTQVKPSYVGVFDGKGNLVNVRKKTSQDVTGLQADESDQFILDLTDQEFQAIQQKGMGRFKSDNGKVVDKPQQVPGQYDYVVLYNDDGTIIDVKKKDGTETGNVLEIPEVQYNDIQAKGKNKFTVANGRLADDGNQSISKGTTVVLPDGKIVPGYGSPPPAK